MVLGRFEEKFGLPPLKDVTTLLSGPTGKRIDSLITRLEKLSQDKSAIVEVLELLKLIQQMDTAGTLDKLNELLKNIPKGKTGQELVSELRKAITELSPRLDRLTNLAKVLMEKED
jgi:Ca2+-binding EF-hand superfamily protein